MNRRRHIARLASASRTGLPNCKLAPLASALLCASLGVSGADLPVAVQAPGTASPFADIC